MCAAENERSLRGSLADMPAPAVIAGYDPQWPIVLTGCCKLFVRHYAHFLTQTGSIFDHIGSTAVPGLPAKPIIDLQVRMPSLPQRAQLADELAPTGFRVALGSRPDSPGVYRDSPRPGSQAPDHVSHRRPRRRPRALSDAGVGGRG